MAIIMGAAVVREVATSTVLANAHSGAAGSSSSPASSFAKAGASLAGRTGWMRDVGALRRRAQFVNRTESKGLGVIRSALVEPELLLTPSSISSKEENNGLPKLQRLVEEVARSGDGRARLQRILAHAATMPRLPSDAKVGDNRVMGCTSQVWLTLELSSDGRVFFAVDSDAEVTRGLCALLVEALNGTTAQEILAVPASALQGLNFGVASPSRANTWSNVLLSLQTRTRKSMAIKAGLSSVEPFPSLLITADDTVAQGDFAEAQARYLSPDKSKVEELATLLREKQIGVVAHFYMDPEVQGVLVAAQKLWPHIHISDSLVMADRAVSMANAGCKHVAVLGVDFMSENVRAILDRAGHEEVSVYRMSADHIGCSLAEAAESASYIDFLDTASKTPKSMHVIYINTSLETKAQAHSRVPTITCTSSNVVQTVLQGFAQVPDLTVWYGPDSYMGANLVEMFRQMLSFTDEEIAAIHPSHSRETIAALLPRLKYFEDGTCIVHDMFGKDVVDRVRQGYGDAFQTAHFEVPGEMFALAMEAKQRGMGVVGSTSNILDFIKKHVSESLQRGFEDRLQFVLGTESGMVTSIVGGVRKLLTDHEKKHGGSKVAVEIVFPVSSQAVTATTSSSSTTNVAYEAILAKLPIVPGVASGEGCSISGGCASCHYMKMNTLNSLLRVCRLVNTKGEPLLIAHHARAYTDLIDGQSLGDLGCEPILHMRQFQAKGSLPDTLVQQICR